jgi:hypothetical protein
VFVLWPLHIWSWPWLCKYQLLKLFFYGLHEHRKYFTYTVFENDWLTFLTICTYKKLFQKNRNFDLKIGKSRIIAFFFEITFLGAFCAWMNILSLYSRDKVKRKTPENSAKLKGLKPFRKIILISLSHSKKTEFPRCPCPLGNNFRWVIFFKNISSWPGNEFAKKWVIIFFFD